jgi:nucleotide-binding universal stress UspA family protein
MIRLRRVLFPTDFSASADRAFDLALLLAQEFGADLHMFHAVVLHEDDPHNPAHHFPDPVEIHRRLEGLADSAMTRQLERGRATEARIEQVRSRGISAAPTILEYAEGWDADLIVMGTAGRRGPSHLLLGSVAEEVSSHARCPVLTVRDGEPAPPPGLPRRVLAPVDLSEHSRRSLEVAQALAERFGAPLQALHVVEEVTYPPYLDQTFNVSEQLVSRAARALDELVKGALGDRPVEQSVVVGHRAAPTIVELAGETGSDLVVVASHGLGGLREFLFGSTAKRIVQHSAVPVLTVKAFGKSLLAETD